MFNYYHYDQINPILYKLVVGIFKYCACMQFRKVNMKAYCILRIERNGLPLGHKMYQEIYSNPEC